MAEAAALDNGRHYKDGCCFDQGNAETDSRDDNGADDSGDKLVLKDR